MNGSFVITKDIINSLDIPSDLKKEVIDVYGLEYKSKIYHEVYANDFSLSTNYSDVDIALIKRYKSYTGVSLKTLIEKGDEGYFMAYSIEDEYIELPLNKILNAKIPFFLMYESEIYVVRYFDGKRYIIYTDDYDIIVSNWDVYYMLPDLTEAEKHNIKLFKLMNSI